MPSSATGISARQRRFVQEFLACGNIAAAARNAGYSARSASRLGIKTLRKPAVQAAIAEAEADKLAELRVSRDRLAASLAEIAIADSARLDELRCTGRDRVQACKLLLELSGSFEKKFLHRVEAAPDWKALLSSGSPDAQD